MSAHLLNFVLVATRGPSIYLSNHIVFRLISSLLLATVRTLMPTRISGTSGTGTLEQGNAILSATTGHL
jgi:hypothetical protein